MNKYVCIHGHFYQPPRENPWLEAVELQDSAYPYHDWNERITAECYAPNSAARMLDGSGKIAKIVNNYAAISFNFGPTLLSWLKAQAPDVYLNILAADRLSMKKFGGYGSALSQAYNHMILPLANSRDKRTQILWGVRDFETRFNRRPDGMWLPEAAVDLETLDLLAEQGIRFTVLAPSQANRVRPLAGGEWQEVSNGRIDPTAVYLQRLPSGRTINLFFYDGPISRAIAFEDLLTQGENLANRLVGAFIDTRTHSQIVHIATDGETYGHHRVHGDMGLAYAIDYIQRNKLASITNYAEYLHRHPPVMEVEIFENSSWSCVHGVERWRSDCGCNSGMKPGWHQQWRAPLRDALDWLRDQLAGFFEREAALLLTDPWDARDDYIEVILDRSEASVDTLLRRHAARTLNEEECVRVLCLLEMQRQAMLMYTSCGWFFDELSGIETVQVLQYASRAMQLSEEVFGLALECQFLERLEKAPSNLPELRNGRLIYEKYVAPSRVGLEHVAAHYAVSVLFTPVEGLAHIYSHEVEESDHRLLQDGKTKLAAGRIRVRSNVTGQSQEFAYVSVHLGDQNLSGGLLPGTAAADALALFDEIEGCFWKGDVPQLLRLMDLRFPVPVGLRRLFRDEQRRIVNDILEQALGEAASLYRSFYNQYGSLARFLNDLSFPIPKRFQMAVEFTLQQDLLDELSMERLDSSRVAQLLDQARRTGILIDHVTLEFALRRNLDCLARNWVESPFDAARMELLDQALQVLPVVPFQVSLWTVQNAVEAAIRTRWRDAGRKGQRGAAWRANAIRLAESLNLVPPALGIAGEVSVPGD